MSTTWLFPVGSSFSFSFQTDQVANTKNRKIIQSCAIQVIQMYLRSSSALH